MRHLVIPVLMPIQISACLVGVNSLVLILVETKMPTKNISYNKRQEVKLAKQVVMTNTQLMANL